MITADEEALLLIYKAGMSAFQATDRCYLASMDRLYPSSVAPIASIQPIVRALGVPYFNEERAFSILRAIEANEPLPPVRVEKFAESNPPFTYALHDGFHRFHLSAALGFSHIPIAIMCED